MLNSYVVFTIILFLIFIFVFYFLGPIPGTSQTEREDRRRRHYRSFKAAAEGRQNCQDPSEGRKQSSGDVLVFGKIRQHVFGIWCRWLSLGRKTTYVT